MQYGQQGRRCVVKHTLPAGCALSELAVCFWHGSDDDNAQPVGGSCARNRA